MRKPTLAVLGGLLVFQIANLCTTVFLHRASAHRAVNLKGPDHVRVPLGHLDHHGDPTP